VLEWEQGITGTDAFMQVRAAQVVGSVQWVACSSYKGAGGRTGSGAGPGTETAR